MVALATMFLASAIVLSSLPALNKRFGWIVAKFFKIAIVSLVSFILVPQRINNIIIPHFSYFVHCILRRAHIKT